MKFEKPAILVTEALHDPADQGSADSPEDENWDIRLGNDGVCEAEQHANDKSAHPSWPWQRHRANHEPDGKAIDECAQQCGSFVGETERKHGSRRERAIHQAADSPEHKS